MMVRDGIIVKRTGNLLRPEECRVFIRDHHESYISWEEFGDGFSIKNIWNMIRFTEVFPDEKIVYALRRQLSWTHFRKIIYLDDPLRREFYAEMCRIEQWSTRMLESKINGMLFERTTLSKKPGALAPEFSNAE
jgi:hypothetical protein